MGYVKVYGYLPLLDVVNVRGHIEHHVWVQLSSFG